MNKKTNLILFPWLLVMYEIVVYLSMDAYVPALPEISTVFGIEPSMAQLTMALWMAGGLLVQFIFGPLSDRYGRRPILLYGGVLYIITTLICAIAPNIHVLLIARLFQGMAMPAMFIAGYAAVNELFGSEDAVSILARMNSVAILAPAFGPLLGGAFLLAFDWRWIFVILALCAVISVSMLYFYMPETVANSEREKPFSIKAIIQQYIKTSTNAPFIALSMIAFLPIIGLIAWMLAGPFIIIHQFHHSTFFFGVIQIFVFGSFIIGTKIADKFANKDRNDSLINLGLGVAVLGSILAVCSSWLYPQSLFITILFIMFVTFGSGLSLPILSRLSLEASNEPMGIKVTVFSVIRISSGVIGSVCMTIAYNDTLLSIAAIIAFFTIIAVALRAWLQLH